MTNFNPGLLDWLESEGLKGSALIMAAERIHAALTYRATARTRMAFLKWTSFALNWKAATHLYRRVEFMDANGGSLVFSATGVTLDDVTEVLFLIDQPELVNR